VLVGRAESTTSEGLERLTATLGDELRSSGIEPPADFT
jgi:hypothetical protein